jgi:hypothetical protein
MNIIPPFRLKVIMALCDVLKGITPDNGYQMDLSSTEDGELRVIRGKLFLGDDDPDEIVTILEPPTAVEPIAQRSPDNQTRSNEWDLLVQGWAKDDRDNEPCDKAYVLAADVQKALAKVLASPNPGRPGAREILGFGNKIYDFKIGTPVVRPTEAVSGYGVFYLILTMKIVEDMADPLG